MLTRNQIIAVAALLVATLSTAWIGVSISIARKSSPSTPVQQQVISIKPPSEDAEIDPSMSEWRELLPIALQRAVSVTTPTIPPASQRDLIRAVTETLILCRTGTLEDYEAHTAGLGREPSPAMYSQPDREQQREDWITATAWARGPSWDMDKLTVRPRHVRGRDFTADDPPVSPNAGGNGVFFYKADVERLLNPRAVIYEAQLPLRGYAMNGKLMDGTIGLWFAADPGGRSWQPVAMFAYYDPDTPRQADQAFRPFCP